MDSIIVMWSSSFQHVLVFRITMFIYVAECNMMIENFVCRNIACGGMALSVMAALRKYQVAPTS